MSLSPILYLFQLPTSTLYLKLQIVLLEIEIPLEVKKAGEKTLFAHFAKGKEDAKEVVCIVDRSSRPLLSHTPCSAL
jgi:hypothetical protein